MMTTVMRSIDGSMIRRQAGTVRNVLVQAVLVNFARNEDLPPSKRDSNVQGEYSVSPTINGTPLFINEH
jgi:hypothetical protein